MRRWISCLVVSCIALPMFAWTPCFQSNVGDPTTCGDGPFFYQGLTAAVTVIYTEGGIATAVGRSGGLPIGSAHFSQVESAVDGLRLRVVPGLPNVRDFYDGNTYVMRVDAANLGQFVHYIHSQPRPQGWWRDLRDGLRAGPTERCKRATNAAAFAAIGFFLAAGAAPETVLGIAGVAVAWQQMVNRMMDQKEACR